MQQALNAFEPIDGGPTQRLKEDGLFGPRTSAAIIRFQKKWSISEVKGSRVIEVGDGIVDPDGPTLQRLSAGPGPSLSARDEVTRSQDLVSATLRMANVSIRKIVEFYRTNPKNNDLLLSGDPDLVAFQRNFHVLKSTAPLALARFVQSKLVLMKLSHRQIVAPNSNLVAIDPAFDTTRAIAFSWPGGHFKSGPGDPPNYQHHDMHKIYFCPACRAMDVSGIGYVICHELGHYVDSQGCSTLFIGFAFRGVRLGHRVRRRIDPVGSCRTDWLE